MKYKHIVAGLLAATALTTAAHATDLEVTHWWTSGGEAAAVAEMAKAFDASGDHWIDGAIAGSGGTARPIIISRILGGDPMGATQLNHGLQAQEYSVLHRLRSMSRLLSRPMVAGWSSPRGRQRSFQLITTAWPMSCCAIC